MFFQFFSELCVGCFLVELRVLIEADHLSRIYEIISEIKSQYPGVQVFASGYQIVAVSCSDVSSLDRFELLVQIYVDAEPVRYFGKPVFDLLQSPV